MNTFAERPSSPTSNMLPLTPSSTSSSPNRNHMLNFPIPLNSPNPRTSLLFSNNHPFGINPRDNNFDPIPLNLSSSSTTATTPTTYDINTPQTGAHSMNSPFSPQTPYYDDRRNTNNANMGMNNEEEVFEVRLVLRHNAHDPFQPKYLWHGTSRWLNRNQLDNKYVEKIKKETEKCSVIDDQSCSFNIPFENDQKITLFCPFHIDANSVNSVPIPSNPPTPIINSSNIELKKECRVIDLVDLISDSLSEHSIINNVDEKEENNDCASPPIQQQEKQVRFSDIGYCILCQKQFEGKRGLAMHTRRVHAKSDTNISNETTLQTKKRKRKQNNVVINGENQRKKRKLSDSDHSSDEEDSIHSISSMDIASNNNMEQITADNETTNNAQNDIQYDVCKILSKKWIDAEDGGNALTFYLIDWSGYELNEATWVQELGLDCPSVLKRFERSIKHLDECDKCKLGGYDCSTLPCFKHHCRRRDYDHIFSDYTKDQIRTISQVSVGISRAEVEKYAADSNFDFDII